MDHKSEQRLVSSSVEMTSDRDVLCLVAFGAASIYITHQHHIDWLRHVVEFQTHLGGSGTMSLKSE